MTRPNIIVFFTDQQRYDTSGLHGNPLDLMPNFDRMARSGTHIETCITCQPVCAPARTCLQTGLSQTQTGVFKNGLAPTTDTRMLGHHFSDAGYQTAYIGKWHLAPDSVVARVGPGIVPEEYRGGYQYWLASNMLEFTSDAYQTTLFDNDNRPVELPGYRADAVTDAAIRYLDSADPTKPSFLFLSYLEPHHQNRRDDYPAPVGYEARYRDKWAPPDLLSLGGSSGDQLAGYWGMVKRLDEAFGRLVDSLISKNRLDNTVILFVSDHGCHFKTRNDEYKRSCHESSVRVPAMFSGGIFNGYGPLRQLVSLIDLPPTLLDIAGIEIPVQMEGRSIVPLIQDREHTWDDAVLIRISETQVGRAVRTDRWKYSVCAPEADGLTHLYADRYVEEFLYDLETDPYELHNLIRRESHRSIAAQLRQKLIHLLVDAGEPRPQILRADDDDSGSREASPAGVI